MFEETGALANVNGVDKDALIVFDRVSRSEGDWASKRPLGGSPVMAPWKKPSGNGSRGLRSGLFSSSRAVLGRTGYTESFNEKLRDELLNGKIFTTLQEAKVLTEIWHREYNQVRPHSSLGYKPPSPGTISGPVSATAS
jgi:hypothetical protein